MTNFTQTTLIESIGECCKKAHLSYSNLLPTQVSPGIFCFHATEMTDDCAKRGYCRQMRYYAREVGGEMVLC
jgi:hypothetical protein